MTLRELMIGQLGRGPANVNILRAAAMSHGIETTREQVRDLMDTIIADGVAERYVADVYRLSPGTPIETSTTPEDRKPRLKGTR